MSLEQTRQTISRYFHVMSGGGDLAECYSADVTWTTTETGEELRGASSVRDYVVALHNNMFAAQTRRLVVADGPAYPEGDCVEAHTGTGGRIYYWVAYDVVDDRIAAMRCYGSIALVAP
jgi:hypothetical protein